ncbi:hypothetical protein OAS86_07100, partial [Gammaproteobacteria bacterium]|nr:hypothetical protein [Gammaproteobacteria bacterium]
SFPEDYPNEQLKGRTITFDITVKAVNEAVLPELDDEFAATLGVAEGGAEKVRDEVRKNLVRELDQRLGDRRRQVIFDALLEANPLEVPQAAIDAEATQMLRSFQQRLGENASMVEDRLEMFRPGGERRVKLSMLVGRYIEGHEIKLDETLLDEKLQLLASGYEDSDEFIQHIRADKQELNNLQARVLEDQVVDAMFAEANSSDLSMSFQELVQRVEAAAE